MRAPVVVDLFAGAGGWSEGLRLAGFDGVEIGLEWDHAACRTAVAAGHRRVQCDVASYPTSAFGEVDGLIASPPCTTFSTAGGRAGFDDPRGLLSHEPLRWARELRPRWVALEQVPDVLPHWQAVTRELRGLGYSTWCGVVNAADHGVPQVRRRAVALARRDGIPARPPEPTHTEHGEPSLFGDALPQWRSMTDTLGADVPWRFVSAGVTGQGRPRDPRTRPADTITAKATAAWVDGNRHVRRVSIPEAAAFQSFPSDYPWRGTQTEQYAQIGNAIPPKLAASVLAPLLAADRLAVAS